MIMIDELKNKIVKSYQEGVTLEEAERLAAEFLSAQLHLAEELRVSDLDARMRKSGLKTIKSSVRQEELKKHDKKPTENHLEDVVNLSEVVVAEQQSLDEAEVQRDYHRATYDIFREAHIYFRGISKGRYE